MFRTDSKVTRHEFRNLKSISTNETAQPQQLNYWC